MSISLAEPPKGINKVIYLSIYLYHEEHEERQLPRWHTGKTCCPWACERRWKEMSPGLEEQGWEGLGCREPRGAAPHHPTSPSLSSSLIMAPSESQLHCNDSTAGWPNAIWQVCTLCGCVQYQLRDVKVSPPCLSCWWGKYEISAPGTGAPFHATICACVSGLI